MSLKSFARKSLATILLTGATIFNSNAQNEPRRIPYVDVFSQPNDTNLIWYGSGDVNLDNVVNWADYSAMSSISNDMSDIDGDGNLSTANDTLILGQFLRNEIPYLPSNWTKSDSTEKRNWLIKMLAIDNTEYTSYPGSGNCWRYANKLHYHFHGGDLDEFKDSANSANLYSEYKLNYVGRFNIPVYEVRIRGPPGHSIDEVFLGQDDPTNYNYALIEPQTDDIYKFTNTYIGSGEKTFLNNNITFYDTYYNYTYSFSDSQDFISFYIDSLGNANPGAISTGSFFKKNLVLHNPNKDKNPPELIINSPKQDSIYNNFNIFLDYYAKDSIFIDSANFNLNNSIQDIDCSTPLGWNYTYCDSIQGEIQLDSLNLKQGKNQLIFNVDDIAKPNKHHSIDTIDFIIDTKNPNITLTSPENNSYYSSNPNLEVMLQDANLDSENSYFKLNTEINYFPQTQDTILNYSEELNSQEGQNNLLVYVKDKANHDSTITRTFIKDSFSPETNFSIQDSAFYNSNEINFELTDPNLELDSCYYKINNSKHYFTSASGSINSPEILEGENNFISYVKDKAGNLTQDTITNFIVDRITPEVSISSPENNSYYSSNPNLEVILQDPNLDSENSYFKLNGVKTSFPDTLTTILNYSKELNSKEGQNHLYINVKDKANNNQNKSINFIKDTQVPVTNFSIQDGETYNYNVTNTNYSLEDENLNLDSCYYITNGEKNYYISTSGTISLNSQNGENEFFSHSEDYAKNITEKQINYTQKTDGINENSANKNSLEQNFPNPFHNLTKIKYTISKPENVSLKVYDIQGKELESLVNEKQTPNTYIKTFDASDYSSGTYFYRLTTPEKTEIKKMIKTD